MRVLIVSYHLYPDTTSEGLCVAKTARALRDVGHDVVVLTSVRDEADSDVLEVDGLLEGVRVIRVAARPELLPRWSRPFYALARLRLGGALLRRHLWGRVSAVPGIVFGYGERELTWILAAAQRVEAVWNDAPSPFDVVHSRLNHSCSHFAVLRALPRMRGTVRWCAHFSDPWPHHRYPAGYASRVGPLLRLRLDQLMDQVLDRADSLTFPSERLLRFVLSDHRKRHRAKAFAVPHLGNFWGESPAYVPGEVLQIVHAGFLLRQRVSNGFFRALRLFLDRTPEAAGRVEVRFVGKNVEALDALIHEHGLQGVIRRDAYSEFTQVWPLLCRADVLLLMESEMGEGIFMPSKLADYLASRRPILALSPSRGTVADYLANGGGLRVDPGDEAQIAETLARLYSAWRAGRIDDAAPTLEHVSPVTPGAVVPMYEMAFRAPMLTNTRSEEPLQPLALALSEAIPTPTVQRRRQSVSRESER